MQCRLNGILSATASSAFQQRSIQYLVKYRIVILIIAIINGKPYAGLWQSQLRLFCKQRISEIAASKGCDVADQKAVVNHHFLQIFVWRLYQNISKIFFVTMFIQI